MLDSDEVFSQMDWAEAIYSISVGGEPRFVYDSPPLPLLLELSKSKMSVSMR